MQQYQMDQGNYDPRLALQQYQQQITGGMPMTLDHLAMMRQYLQQQQAQGVPLDAMRPPMQHVPQASGSTSVRG